MTTLDDNIMITVVYDAQSNVLLLISPGSSFNRRYILYISYPIIINNDIKYM